MRKAQPILVTTPTEALIYDLTSYGEFKLAKLVPGLSKEQMNQIFEVAGEYTFSKKYLRPSGASMYLAKALVLATIKVIEGKERPTHFSRRKLKQ